jgi:hypothetical protein
MPVQCAKMKEMRTNMFLDSYLEQNCHELNGNESTINRALDGSTYPSEKQDHLILC